MKMTNEQYDKLMKICLCISPVIVFVGAVGAALDIQGVAIVSAILAAAQVCLGKIIDICRQNYQP